MRDYSHLTDRDCPRPRSRDCSTGIPFIMLFQFLAEPIGLTDRELSQVAIDLVRYSKAGGLEAELTVSQVERLVEGINAIAFFAKNPETRSAAGLGLRSISKSVKVHRALSPIVVELSIGEESSLPEFSIDSEIPIALDTQHFVLPSVKALSNEIRSMARKAVKGDVPIALADLRNTKQAVAGVHTKAQELAQIKRWQCADRK